MDQHPALASGHTAVVTGAASGIGLAAAERFASLGMNVVMADANAAALEREAARLEAGGARVVAVPTDVGRREDMERLAAMAQDAFGEVHVLMANAGREGGGALTGDPSRWTDILQTNLWGVIHAIQVFTPGMTAGGRPGAVIVTGSKQGITTPPGDTAYNVSKAGVKVATEALAHDLRNVEGCRVTAHLLIPGFTFTGLTKVRVSEKPPGAWTPEQVVDFMLPAMARGDFYILCPDNDVSRALDEQRIAWAAGDIVENRPPLSRWHPDWAQRFKDWAAT